LLNGNEAPQQKKHKLCHKATTMKEKEKKKIPYISSFSADNHAGSSFVVVDTVDI
jgi:hypothetical protein